ncbi:hypothetical protein [Turneriella parva]|uniref:hypothetical protein n=1 Tax=Turneriella parva TaxID=29510 RepID=UPI0012F671AB|nr:hypothetical protein [Turneriella parva]
MQLTVVGAERPIGVRYFAELLMKISMFGFSLAKASCQIGFTLADQRLQNL